jgi:diguanylate cyclase (GGDEF)-like protein
VLNRVALFAALDRHIAQAASTGRVLGVLMLRTQRMREFDLLFGYEAGERVADAMRTVLDAALRAVDEVVQIGECDFAVILPDLHDRNHAALAAAKLVRTLQLPLEIEGRQFLAPAAIGAAVYPEDGADADLLCRHADIACAEAASGSERFALYASPDIPDAFAHGDLRDAIVRNQLLLFLQPIVALQGERCMRAEALSRWTHPVHGAIAPEAFIQVAEQTGLISELTRWNFNVALRHAAQARDCGHPLALSLNVSIAVLRQDTFVEQVLGMLRLWNVPTELVTLEVTESGLMRDLAYCERKLRQLRDHGFGIAIDDFGTGYSSMAYLKRLPATELKIDKTFVLDMVRDTRVVKLVGSMIDVSHHLGLEVVAEGVEDADTLTLLRGLGCDHAQGYHLGRPLPAADVLATLESGARH